MKLDPKKNTMPLQFRMMREAASRSYLHCDSVRTYIQMRETHLRRATKTPLGTPKLPQSKPAIPMTAKPAHLYKTAHTKVIEAVVVVSTTITQDGGIQSRSILDRAISLKERSGLEHTLVTTYRVLTTPSRDLALYTRTGTNPVCYLAPFVPSQRSNSDEFNLISTTFSIATNIGDRSGVSWPCVFAAATLQACTVNARNSTSLSFFDHSAQWDPPTRRVHLWHATEGVHQHLHPTAITSPSKRTKHAVIQVAAAPGPRPIPTPNRSSKSKRHPSSNSISLTLSRATRQSTWGPPSPSANFSFLDALIQDPVKRGARLLAGGCGAGGGRVGLEGCKAGGGPCRGGVGVDVLAVLEESLAVSSTVGWALPDLESRVWRAVKLLERGLWVVLKFLPCSSFFVVGGVGVLLSAGYKMVFVAEWWCLKEEAEYYWSSTASLSVCLAQLLPSHLSPTLPSLLQKLEEAIEHLIVSTATALSTPFKTKQATSSKVNEI
ncbi:hypothetical protein BDV96DRAFT_677069 [Lophiotrema nucula]|uniref:Uncharacterized protein n=1 Tax=Lophiotrema nucula TaxID=690887 RepID=A0A6A5YEI4_9PLEO|nr:hypothetical protein BDV96DRAFT_677069 [Lophiotrema nucula]